jgi:long-subunit acyl-CoA synthetase (AMP-forming)
LTAKEFIEKSHNIAVALIDNGIKKSDIILIYSENLIEYVITQFAIYLLGNTFTFSNKDNGAYELNHQIKDSGANVIFTSMKRSTIIDKVMENKDINQQIKLVITFDGKHKEYKSFDDLMNESNGKRLTKVPHFEIDLKKDICIIGYTSGTTGLPKGALLTHYAHLGMVMNNDVLFPTIKNFDKPKIFSGHWPLTHVSGTLLFPRSLFSGYAIVNIDYNTDEDLFEAIQQYKVSLLIKL